ncbi:MAG: metallophosphoesterase family protein [Proteobacteria bacterium]|nr:metallophosphoesterase family protein [Pseudomonadota bacterium]
MRLVPTLLLLACTGATGDDNPLVCDGDDEGRTEITIAPYLQRVTQTSAVVMWETTEGVGTRVRFGADESMGEAVCGEVVGVLDGKPEDAPTQVHTATLTGLSPGSTVYYQTQTGRTESEIQHFRTVPSDPETPFRLVAMSDSQQDNSRPAQFAEVVQDGVIAYTRAEYGEDLSEELGLVLFPGDLVDNGWLTSEWQDEFFGPAAELFGAVPVYPAIGNHEGGSPHYFRYFDVPDDGENERFYTTDYANLRVIALDSNPPFDNADQLLWLEGVLEDTCTADDVDFVFAQLHHPWLSELWTPGESDFTGQVAEMIGTFSTDCGKPSIHFFGHTHGYSRGQLRDHDHLMVNVASAGGRIDRWNEHKQADYDEFTVSRDTYGFVLVEVEGGDAPKFTMKRISRGNPDAPEDNALADEITIWASNDAPATPVVSGVDCSSAPTVSASAFSDPDGHGHQASHWQLAPTCDFTSVTTERWMQDQNEYKNEDSQADDDLTDEVFDELSSAGACVRVRYRDEGLQWSDWSAGLTLTSCT